MIQAKLDNCDYDKTIEKLIEINMDTPDSIKNVKMKVMTAEKKKYCFAFNNNDTCKFGSYDVLFSRVTSLESVDALLSFVFLLDFFLDCVDVE